MPQPALRFLINQSFIYHADETKLVHKDDQINSPGIKLDNLESLVLNEFCLRPNELLTYDDLLSLWRSKEVTDSALTRVISKLRKKLKAMGCPNDIIGNIAKKGYKFNTDVSVYNPPTDSSVQSKPGSALKNAFIPKVLTGVAALTILFIALVYSLFSFLSGPTEYLSFKNTTELVSDDSRKRDLTLDKAEDRLAYASYHPRNKYWQLRVAEQMTGQVFDFAEEGTNLINPVWLNDNEIAYRAFNSTSCSIKKVAITATGFTGEPSTLFDCNPQTSGISVAALDEQHLLFTNAPVGKAPAYLYQGNIITGEIEQITLNSDEGVGIYKVVISSDDRTIAILSSPDWNSYQISLLKKNESWQSFWQTTTNAVIYSVGWNGRELTYRNNKGGFSLVSFDNEEVINTQDLSLFSHSYAISNHKQKIAFIEGNLNAKNIRYYNTVTGEGSYIDSSDNHKNALPKFINKHQLLFISDRLGINQLWLHDTDSTSSRQITQFRQHQRIENIAINTALNLIALEVDSTIMLYRYNDEFSQLRLFHQLKGENPSFYQGQLVFSRQHENSYRLNFFDPDSLTTDDVYISGGSRAYPVNNELYYTKYSMPGIWRYIASGQDQYITHIDNNAELISATKDELIYKDQQGLLSAFNINTATTRVIENGQCKNSYDYQFNVCLSTEIKPANTRILISEWNKE